MKIGTFVLALALGVAGNLQAQTPTASTPATAARDAELRSILQAAPMLPFVATPAAPTAPAAGWELGMVSWVAADPNGAMYMLQRGDKADPIIAFDREKRVVRSWGKGLYTTPHALRVDPPGNIWTTDAKTSMVYKFAPDGRMLLEISVGGQPADCTGAFCGTTDVAFAPNGNVFIADGYRNARILEYTPDDRKLREWGTPGTGPGQFRLPHSIVIDEQGIVYVADARERPRPALRSDWPVPRRVAHVWLHVRTGARTGRRVARHAAARPTGGCPIGLADQGSIGRPGPY